MLTLIHLNDQKYMRILIFIFSIAWVAFCHALPMAEREALYNPVVAQMRLALSHPSPAGNIAKLARDSEARFGTSAPDVMVDIYYIAVAIIQLQAANDPESRPCIYELKTRERQFLDSIMLDERMRILNAQPLPLSTEFTLNSEQKDAYRMITEIEYLFQNWRLLNDEIERTKEIDRAPRPELPPTPPSAIPKSGGYVREDGVVVGAGFIHAGRISPESIPDPIERDQYRRQLAVIHEDAEQRIYRSKLRNIGGSFTNSIAQQVAAEYAGSPHLVAQLQGIMDGYLPPADSTNVMNKVFAAMKPEVAAKTPRPVPGAKGERWIRAAAPSGPIIPALAKPSKIRDAFNNRPGQGAVAPGSSGTPTPETESTGGGTGSAGSRPVWPWAVLGLVVLAGGWGWVRTRG